MVEAQTRESGRTPAPDPAGDAANGRDAPFAGLRVYDATHGVAGPHCTMLLALHGADVVKVEPPEGDWARHVGARCGDHSAHSISWNRGKRSLVLDLRVAQARDVALRLAASADVVVESFRPGTMARLGLDYETLAARRPELVYCSVSAFGQQGPYAGDAAVDKVMQGFAGWMHANRDADGSPRAQEMVAIDMVTGLYAFNAIAALLTRRFRFGRGGRVDVSMLSAAIAMLAPQLIEEAGPVERQHVLFSPPNGAFRSADGLFIVAVTRQEHFVAACRAIGRDDLADDPRFASRSLRIENTAALLDALERELARHTNAQLHRAFRQAGALGAPVQDFAAVLNDSHVLAAGLVPRIDVAGFGALPTPRVPGTAAPGSEPRLAAPPRLGEHSRIVLQQIGYGDADIDALIRCGAVRTGAGA